MPQPLGELQRVFSHTTIALFQEIEKRGFAWTYGDAFRDPRAFGAVGVQGIYGHPKSAHKQRLALDVNLFKAGVYLADTESHRQFGEWWEKQHPLARWGGRFSDGNHYSFEYNGMK